MSAAGACAKMEDAGDAEGNAEPGSALAGPGGASKIDVLAQFREVVLTTGGGPMQYLNEQVGTEAARAAFRATLAEAAPKQPQYSYLSGPPDTRAQSYLHASDLGFDLDCSTKPPPFRVTAAALADEYLTHGFITEGGPPWRSIMPPCYYLSLGGRRAARAARPT